MRAQTERTYDEYERTANQAMMMRAAYHAKKLKQTDLFKRPVDDEQAKIDEKNAKERMEERMNWLTRFEEFSHLREEDTDN